MQERITIAVLALFIIILVLGCIAKTAKKQGWFGEAVVIAVFFIAIGTLIFFGL